MTPAPLTEDPPIRFLPDEPAGNAGCIIPVLAMILFGVILYASEPSAEQVAKWKRQGEEAEVHAAQANQILKNERELSLLRQEIERAELDARKAALKGKKP